MSMLLNPFMSFPATGGGSLPAGATGQADFVNGFYNFGGADRLVTNILGGGFDPSSISPSGMYVDNSPSTNRPNAIGALASGLAAGLAAGCTIVFEVNHVGTPYGFLMCIMDAASRSLMTNYVNLGHDHMLEDQLDIWFTGAVDYSASGIHRSAFTLARQTGGNYEYALSINGDAAVTQTVAYAPFSPVNTITIGHDGDDAFVLDDAFIRTITLYPAKLPADLPALTV